MRPIAILSVDTNPAYLSCIPIVCRSWELQGFDVDLTIVADGPLEEECRHSDLIYKYCKNVSGGLVRNIIYNEVNKAMYTQCLRLYESAYFENDRYCILSDADMFIASSFLFRDFDKANVFGHDLTGFGEIPVCYVGMYAQTWNKIFPKGSYRAFDLAKYTKYQSTDWYECWGSDQQILTGKLKEYGYNNINFINRGHDNRNSGLPMGRWDRFNLKKPEGEIHDIHLMRNPISDENFPLLVEMCETCYPKEDWSWLNDYKKEFNEML